MANFNALFAGCESFMEGDVEINNDVSVPAGDTAEAIEAETEAADVGAEGGELAGDVDTEDTKAEATNMVFDQLTAMYRHVKRYGVDRTFLSLYNSNGQLNQMIGYKFPSCESIDSVGSPRSQASRAFIIAMEEDGIFKRIWTWIKETFTKICNFVIKIMDWFREACGNMDLRIGKLRRYFNNSENRDHDEQKSNSVLYYEESAITKYNEVQKKASDELKYMNVGSKITGGTLADLVKVSTYFTSAAEATLKAIQGGMSMRADEHGSANSYGSSRDKDDTNGSEQLKKYADRVQKDLIRPVKDAIKDVAKDKDQLENITGKNGIGLGGNYKALSVTGAYNKGASIDAKTIALANLDIAADISKDALRLKQFTDQAKQNAEHCRQISEQVARQAHGESLSHEENVEARRNTNTAMKGISILTSAMACTEQLMRKIVKQTASLQSLVKPKHT